jgi:hypothetical protein
MGRNRKAFSHKQKLPSVVEKMENDQDQQEQKGLLDARGR